MTLGENFVTNFIRCLVCSNFSTQGSLFLQNRRDVELFLHRWGRGGQTQANIK